MSALPLKGLSSLLSGSHPLTRVGAETSPTMFPASAAFPWCVNPVGAKWLSSPAHQAWPSQLWLWMAWRLPPITASLYRLIMVCQGSALSCAGAPALPSGSLWGMQVSHKGERKKEIIPVSGSEQPKQINVVVLGTVFLFVLCPFAKVVCV